MAKKEITLGKLAEELEGELTGDRNLTVTGTRDIAEAGEGDLVFIFAKKFEHLLEKTKASCAVVPEGIKKSPVPVIKCKNLNLAFKKAAELIFPERIFRPEKGIHKTAVIGKNVTLGKGVTVGAYTVLEDASRIADGTSIHAHSYVGFSAQIGKECIIYPNVTIRENVKLGDRVILHAGCVVGSDGFGYERTEKGHEKIPQIGDVIIENDVELGACVTVDRAKIGHTRIASGTKIDNLVQVGHNVAIGKNCIIVAQCGISGSVKIGDNVMIAGQSGIADHIEIGDNVMIGAKTGVIKSIPSNKIVWGIPARPIKEAKTIQVLMGKLPEIYKRLKDIENKLGTNN